MGLAVQVSAKDCERKAINPNLCLVVAALSVTGAHHRTIEQFVSIILISLSVPGWWVAGRECQRFGRRLDRNCWNGVGMDADGV
jgi:hypothetical protein